MVKPLFNNNKKNNSEMGKHIGLEQNNVKTWETGSIS